MKNLKRIAAALLVICLVLTGIPYNASAASTTFSYNFSDIRTALEKSGYTEADSDWYLKDFSSSLNDLYDQSYSWYENYIYRKTLDMTVADCTYGFSAKAMGSTYGMYTYTKSGTYIAFKMRKSASNTGDFMVQFQHDVSARGGIASVHILPVGTTDIQNKLSSDNRVGVVDFNGGNGNTSPTAAENVFRTDNVGYCTLGSETEFLVVFNFIENSPYFATQSYAFFEALTFNADTSLQVTTSDRITPYVVSNNAVEYFETTVYAAAGKVVEDGRERYNLYLPVEGCRLNVYDLENMVKIDEVTTPFDICRGIWVDDDGMVWMVGGSPNVMKYDPYTGATTDYGSYKLACNVPANSGYYMYEADGYLYFGTSESGYVIRMNKETGAYTAYDCASLGKDKDGAYSCGISVRDGILYCGMSGDKNEDGVITNEILKVDLSTGKLLGSAEFTNLFTDSEVMFRGLATTRDGIVFGSASGCMGMACADSETMERFTPVTKDGTPVYNKINYNLTEIDGVTYMCLGTTGMNYATGEKYAYNSSNLVSAGLYKWVEDDTYPHGGYLEYISSFNKALYCGQDSYAVINGKECLVTYGYDKNKKKDYICIYDMDSGSSTLNYDLIDKEADGAPILLQTLETDKDGNLYMGTFNTSKGSIYNPATESFTGTFFTSGQTDSLVWYDYNGEYNLYAGNYNTGRLTLVNMDGGENGYLVGLKYYDTMTADMEKSPIAGQIYDLHQSRAHTVTAGDGKVFIGTIPDRYLYGGGIGWYDLKTGETFATRFPDQNGDGVGDGVLENQSVIKLVYHEGYLIGLTSTAGGTGAKSQDVNTIQGQLFVYDVAAKKVVYASNLHAELSEKGYELANMSALTALAADPDGNGFWCIASDCLFNFSLDNSGGSMKIKINAMTDYSASRPSTGAYCHSGLRTRDIVFDAENIYAAICDYAGLVRINRKDFLGGTFTSERLPVPIASYYAIGSDNNLYYTKGSALYMYPLTVTEDDIATAKEVDRQIYALGKITVDSKAAVDAAQNAYNALSNEQKAVVKNLYLLEEAQIDLLNARIATIGTDYYENKALIEELMAQYKELPAEDKALVTNYPALKIAYNAIDDKYSVGGLTYGDLTSAVEAAAALPAAERIIKLLISITEGSVLLTDGITLDLNGKTLIVDAITANADGIAHGYVVDSSSGNNGKLVVEAEQATFREDNPDIPLYDPAVGGYRFFDYHLELYPDSEDAGTGRRKFWFRFQFRADDTGSELDQDAYGLVSAGGSTFTIGAKLTWQGTPIGEVYFGKLLNTDISDLEKVDAFSSAWATGATASRWLYATVSGIKDFGTLTIEPVFTANNVTVSAGTITYKHEMQDPDFGWSDGIPD